MYRYYYSHDRFITEKISSRFTYGASTARPRLFVFTAVRSAACFYLSRDLDGVWEKQRGSLDASSSETIESNFQASRNTIRRFCCSRFQEPSVNGSWVSTMRWLRRHGWTGRTDHQMSDGGHGPLFVLVLLNFESMRSGWL